MTEFNPENIKRYLKSKAKQFEIFDMKYYTPEEKECIDNFHFHLKTQLSYNNYGNNNLDDLNEFLIRLGNNSLEQIQTIGNIIKKIIKTVMDGYGMESYWLAIRVTEPSKDWDLPRWHCDGNYFWRTKERKIVSKFVTVFQGAGTLLLKTSNKSQRKKFIDLTKESYKLYKDDFGKEHRENMNNSILGDIIQPTNYQSVIFFSGPKRICGIHSEPEMHTPRMFLSIVPGSIKEIDGWRNKRGGSTKGNPLLGESTKGNPLLGESTNGNPLLGGSTNGNPLLGGGCNLNYISNKNKYLDLKQNIMMH